MKKIIIFLVLFFLLFAGMMIFIYWQNVWEAVIAFPKKDLLIGIVIGAVLMFLAQLLSGRNKKPPKTPKTSDK